jgi:transcriptional regulator with XRE-family HTH domain
MSGRNQKDFSKQCGLNRRYFGGVERGERNLTFSSLCQICAGLTCDIATITEGIPHLTDANLSGKLKADQKARNLGHDRRTARKMNHRSKRQLLFISDNLVNLQLLSAKAGAHSCCS